MWRLVVFTSACLAGLSGTYAQHPIYASDNLDWITKAIPSESSTNAPFVPEPHFNCNDRPSGYYADPRFNCEIFHFCHEDGTQSSMSCLQGDQKHNICLLKDIVSRACDGNEIFLPLPEDLLFKISKDTTVPDLNDATDFKLPQVLPEPTAPAEVTTPSSRNLLDEEDDSSPEPDYSTIHEVHNSFLKEIKPIQEDPRSRIVQSLTLKVNPSNFSRGARLQPDGDLQEALIDVVPLHRRRFDEDDAYLIEIPSRDKGDFIDNDLTSYQRKSKKLYFSSEKKYPVKHPRRRRSVQQLDVSRPYAIIYAKMPDTTAAGSRDSFLRNHKESEGEPDLPYARSYTSGEELVPITIETRQKRKSKSNKKSIRTPEHFDTPLSHPNGPSQQQTSEQQNIYFYSPEEVDPATQPRPSQGHRQREEAVVSRDRQGENPNSLVSAYNRQAGDSVLLPNFPFQSRPAPRQQSPFYFSAPDFQNGGFAPFQLQGVEQFRPRPQPPQTSHQSSPSAQQDPSGTRPQPGIEEDRSSRPQSQSIRGRDPTSGRYQEDPNPVRTLPQPPQPGFSGPRFQNPFFDGFAPFGGPYTPQDQRPYSLIPPSQLQQQPGLRPGAYIDPGMPQFSQPDPAHRQVSHVFTRPGDSRPEIPLIVQPAREPTKPDQGLPQQERPHQPEENSEPQISPQSPRQLRPRGRPSTENDLPPSIQPDRLRQPPRPQTFRQPPPESATVDRSRQRHRHPSPYDERIVYQPGYPQHIATVNEQPPVRNAIPTQFRGPPPVIGEDFRYQSRPHPPTPNTDDRGTVYLPREPVPQRTREERERRPEQGREPPRPQRPRESSYLYSTTSPPSSSRTRTRTRQPSEEEIQRERHLPTPSDDARDSGDRRMPSRHRESPVPQVQPEIVRTRPLSSDVPVSNRYYETPPPPSSNGIPDDYRQQTGSNRHREPPRETTRTRDQAQIERPPSSLIPQAIPEIYSGTQGYYTYPPQGNDVNVVSTVEDSEYRTRAPPSQEIRQPNNRNRGSVSNIRNSPNHVNSDTNLGFLTKTESPPRESFYATRSPTNDFANSNEDNPQSSRGNKFQDFDDVSPTTRATTTTTTRRPRRPPPPKPTFPTFPTFPPPPRRPITSPRPQTESPSESDFSATHDPEVVTSRANSLSNFEDTANRAYDTERNAQTDAPEVTTRKRTRKRRPKPRKPRPSSQSPQDDQGESFTHSPTLRESSTRSSGRGSSRYRQQSPTSQPRNVSPNEEEAATIASDKAEFGSRINLFNRARKPTSFQPRGSTPPTPPKEAPKVSTITRDRKPFAKRVRGRVATTTVDPDTEESGLRSEANSEVLSYQQSEDVTSYVMPNQEYESVTVPFDLGAEILPTIEANAEIVDYTAMPEEEGMVDFGQDDKMEDFDGTRPASKKLQNRPRILKFGKPKLKSTVSPIDLGDDDS